MTQIQQLPVLPLADAVVLPGMVVPVTLDDPERQAAIDAAQTGAEGLVLVVPRLEGKYAPVGVVATIEQLGKLPGGEPAVVLRATGRARVGSGVTGPGSALWVEVEILADVVGENTAELSREYKNVVVSILQQRGAWQVIDSVQRISEPGELSDLAGYAPYLDNEQKLWLLETVEVEERLTKLIGWGREHLAELDVAERIRSDVHEGMEKSQREFLLRQQLAAIRKELGEGEPDGADDYRARVEAAELPDKVLEAAIREVGRLERASEQSPEAGWIRTWLDTVLELPWNVRTEDNTDVIAAREVLDADHEGLADVKDRMVEYLAVRSRRQARGLAVVGGRGSGAVLALVGPPGVGKTSLGESVARALGRKFVRVSLGGVRDEAEIRGHRRTYVGALPGRIVRAMREAGSMNPVVLLRRDRQARQRLSRRPRLSAFGGARPGPEPHLPRPLPRDRARPLRRALPGDGERGRDDPARAVGPDGDRQARRIHRGREGRHRTQPPRATADRPRRPGPRRGLHRRRGARASSHRSTPTKRACASSSAPSQRSSAR